MKQDDVLEQYDFNEADFMYDHMKEYEVFIGRYIILFSYLEHNLNRLIANMLSERGDELGYLVTTKMSMLEKIDMLDRLTKLSWVGVGISLKKVIKALSKLRELNSFRNIIVHANWASMQEGGKVRVKIKVDQEKGIWFENRKITSKDICRKTHILEEAIHDTEDIFV